MRRDGSVVMAMVVVTVVTAGPAVLTVSGRRVRGGMSTADGVDDRLWHG